MRRAGCARQGLFRSAANYHEVRAGRAHQSDVDQVELTRREGHHAELVSRETRAPIEIDNEPLEVAE